MGERDGCEGCYKGISRTINSYFSPIIQLFCPFLVLFFQRLLFLGDLSSLDGLLFPKTLEINFSDTNHMKYGLPIHFGGHFVFSNLKAKITKCQKSPDRLKFSTPKLCKTMWIINYILRCRTMFNVSDISPGKIHTYL